MTLEDLKCQILFKILYSGKTFIDIPVNTDQIHIWFDANTPGKTKAICPSQLSKKDLVKKLLTGNQIFQLLVNAFLSRSLSECHAHMMGMFLSVFQAIYFKYHANLSSINGNIKESYI